jgi:hypothetical protein
VFVKALILLFCSLLPFNAYAAPTPPNATDAAQKQIEDVIENFRTAIIDKDKDRFIKLFLHESITWQRVLSDEGLQRFREKQPDVVKTRFDSQKTASSFIDGIVANKRRTEEKFWNIRIDTDGDIASVYFDYSFHADDRETNHGKEAWHLVNTGEGWKIVSVIWSVIPTQEKKS